MNKSIEFVKDRIKNNQDCFYNMPLEGWEDSEILNPLFFMRDIPQIKIENNTLNFVLSDSTNEINVEIEYNPDAEFDYITTTSSTHDGTLYFVIECYKKILNKLLTASTYYKCEETKDFQEHPFDYNIKYIIGDLLRHTDHGMKNINGHNWSGQTDICVLPIKFIATKKIR